MNVGDTFVIDGVEYSVKNIDMDPKINNGTGASDIRFPNGRVDASKFIGIGPFRKISVGRPKMFKIEDVASAIGEDMLMATPTKAAPIKVTQTKDDGSWESKYCDECNDGENLSAVEDDISPDRTEELLNILDDDSTASDW